MEKWKNEDKIFTNKNYKKMEKNWRYKNNIKQIKVNKKNKSAKYSF